MAEEKKYSYIISGLTWLVLLGPLSVFLFLLAEEHSGALNAWLSIGVLALFPLVALFSLRKTKNEKLLEEAIKHENNNPGDMVFTTWKVLIPPDYLWSIVFIFMAGAFFSITQEGEFWSEVVFWFGIVFLTAFIVTIILGLLQNIIFKARKVIFKVDDQKFVFENISLDIKNLQSVKIFPDFSRHYHYLVMKTDFGHFCLRPVLPTKANRSALLDFFDDYKINCSVDSKSSVVMNVSLIMVFVSILYFSIAS